MIKENNKYILSMTQWNRQNTQLKRQRQTKTGNLQQNMKRNINTDTQAIVSSLSFRYQESAQNNTFSHSRWGKDNKILCINCYLWI